MTIARGVLVALVCVALASPAGAVPRHDKVQVTPIKKNGQVVGARITMVLLNDHSAMFPDAYVGLVNPSVTRTISRPQAVQPNLGQLVHQFPPVKGLQMNQPHEAKFEIIYGAGNSLKSGDHLDVISAWPGNGTTFNNPHVFGAVLGGGRPAGHSGDITLP
jgi:hypothetical protein